MLFVTILSCNRTGKCRWGLTPQEAESKSPSWPGSTYNVFTVQRFLLRPLVLRSSSLLDRCFLHLVELFAFVVRQPLVQITEVRLRRRLFEEVDQVRLRLIVQLPDVVSRFVRIGHQFYRIRVNTKLLLRRLPRHLPAVVVGLVRSTIPGSSSHSSSSSSL